MNNTRVEQRLQSGRLICTAWGLGAWFHLTLSCYVMLCYFFFFIHSIPFDFIMSLILLIVLDESIVICAL